MNTSASSSGFLFLSMALLSNPSGVYGQALLDKSNGDAPPASPQGQGGTPGLSTPSAQGGTVIEELSPVVDLTARQVSFEPSLMAQADAIVGMTPQPASLNGVPATVGSLEVRVSEKATANVLAEDAKRSKNLAERTGQLEGRMADIERLSTTSMSKVMKSQDRSVLMDKLAKPVPTGTPMTSDHSAVFAKISPTPVATSKLDSLAVIKDALRQAMEKIPADKISNAQKFFASLKLQRILKDTNLKSAQLVSLNLDALKDTSKMDTQIKLCNGVQIFCRAIQTTGWVQSSPTVQRLYVTLQPKDPTEPAGNVLFVKSGTSSIGVVTIGTSNFTVIPLANNVSVVTSSASTAMERNMNDVAALSDGKNKTKPTGGTAPLPAPLIAPLSIHTDADCPNPKDAQTIDLLIASTKKATSSAFSDGHDVALLTHLAQELSNHSFSQSGINGRVSITEQISTDYVESGDFSKDVEELTNPSGVLKKVHDERKRIKADVVVLVVDNPDPRNCGIASVIGAQKENAFVVVNWRCLTDRFSFIHEIGHLAGAWHDPATLGNGYTVDPPYASGYVTAGDHPMATIMAYTSACPKPCGRSYFWANPFVMSPYGEPLGTIGKNFDACVWRKRFETMAKFDGG